METLGSITFLFKSILSHAEASSISRYGQDTDLLSVRRLFESQWSYDLPKGASRLERVWAHLTEVNKRLILPNDFLLKVDTASMKESLEVRVPMSDEDLFAFTVSLPHW